MVKAEVSKVQGHSPLQSIKGLPGLHETLSQKKNSFNFSFLVPGAPLLSRSFSLLFILRDFALATLNLILQLGVAFPT